MLKFIAIALSLFFVACSAGKNRTNIEVAQSMMDQESIKAQDWDPKQPDRILMMNPPEGTIPRNKKVYAYKNNLKLAEKELRNPMKRDSSPQTLSLGKKYFDIYCAVCHGFNAKGGGTVAAAMPIKPPSLLQPHIYKYSDTRIFHIISEGQGVMGSYASQIQNHKYRWAIVNYLRSLQKKERR